MVEAAEAEAVELQEHRIKLNKKFKPIIIRGSGGGKGGGGGSSYAADDNLFARQSATFIDAIAEGPIKGLVHGDASIFIDETRLRDVDLATGNISKTANFDNFEVVTANGLANQTPDGRFFAEFPTAAIVEQKSGTVLKDNEPQYFTISSSQFEKRNADYLKVTIFTNAMVRLVKTGKKKGDQHETSVNFTIKLRYVNNAGTTKTTTMFNTGFRGKCTAKYAHTFGFNIEDIKDDEGILDWAIEVTRLSSSPSSDDDNQVSNDIFVESIEASIADKLEYPFTAYVAGNIDAENFNSIPKRGYEIDGKLISVPTNYVPPEYDGLKLTVASTTSFQTGESISQAITASALGGARDSNTKKQTATITINSGHGLPVGNIVQLTVAGASVSNYNGTFDCIVTSTTKMTYEVPLDSEASDISNSPSGTITVSVASMVIDKIVGSTTIYVRGRTSTRDVPVTGGTITGATSSATTTVSAVDKIFIPAHYRRSPSTEKITTTEQDWDGSFYQSWSNNPAWVLYDLMTNKRYGLGNYITAAQINKWELFGIGRYCDELVPANIPAADFLSLFATSDTNYIPSGSTGLHEPRFAANVVLQTKAEAFKVISDLASVMRGMIVWKNGEAVVVQDSEKDPVYQFSNGNVINGEFEYEGSALKSRSNQVVVTWNNPKDLYRKREEYVENEEVLQLDDDFVKPSKLTAFGCTSRGQARRLGKWKMLSENLNTQTVSFKTSINASFLQPGDIINVLDKRKQGKSWGGRISAVTDTNTFTLDREFALDSGYAVSDYKVSISFSGQKCLLAQDSATIGGSSFVRGDIISGITTIEASQKIQDDSGNTVFTQFTPYSYVEEKTLASIDGTSNGKTTITVSGNYSTAPVVDQMFVIQRPSLTTGKTEQVAQQFRVVSVAEDSNTEFSITGLEYNPTKFDNVDKNEPIKEYNTLFLPNSGDAVPNVTKLRTSTSQRLLSDGVKTNVLDITWEEPKNADGSSYAFVKEYVVEYSIDNVKFLTAGSTTGTDFALEDAVSQTYYIRVRVFNMLGKASPVVTGTFDVNFQTVNLGEEDEGAQYTVNKTGTLTNASIELNTTTGLVSFTPDDFNYSALGATTTVSNQSNLDFSGLSNSETGFILFDKSASAFVAREKHSASDAYFAVGGSPYATATGTITATQSDIGRDVTGSGTAFTTELASFNPFKATVSSVDYYFRAGEISSDTALVADEPLPVDISGGAFSKPTTLVDYANDSIFGSVKRNSSTSYTLTLFGVTKGEPAYNVAGSNENHTFLSSDSSGTLSSSVINGFSCSYTVSKGTTAFSFASSGTTAATFGLSISASGCTAAVSGSGVITVSAVASSSATITVTVTDLAAGSTIATRVITLTKALKGTDGVVGSDGADGLRSVQGYLYYEKTTSGAPSAPGSTTYRFATGDVDGGSGATEVLALADTSATNKWTNQPRTQDPTQNTHWTVRYFGTESSAGSSTCTVSYSTIVQHTNFSGVVTFSGGTFSEGGTAITSIDGGNIATGTITADRIKLSGTGGLTIGSLTNDSGFVNTTQAAAAAPIQSINGSTGTAGAVTISASGLNITSSDVSGLGDAATSSISSIRSGTTASDVGLGNVDNVSASTIRSGTTASDVGLGNVDNLNAASIRSGTTKSDVGLGNVDNTSAADIRAGTTASDVGLGNVSNLTTAQVIQTLFTASTSVTAGRIKLTSGTTQFLSDSTSTVASNSIDIDSRSGNGGPRIVIADSS